jgi:hypothetical protein
LNKYKSIITYRKKVESNPFLRLKENLKVKSDLKKLIKSINPVELNKIQTEYKNYDPAPGYSKYLNIKPWMLDNVWRTFILGLNNSSGKNILDIGTGNGYFPYACKFYNHTVRSIDIESNDIFNELISLLEIPRLEYAVQSYTPIPKFDVKFDLFTGFHTYFNGHRTENVWKKEEWDFFLKDLKNNHGHENSEAYFIINQEHHLDYPIAPELVEYFISKGAEISNDRVYFKDFKNI